MKVSILLPAYKSEKLLQKVFCKSWFTQYLDKPGYELVIYDNGGNGKAVSCFKATNYEELEEVEELLGIKALGDENNIGLNKALNECAKIASGDYFFLPHTDMYMLPGCIEALLEAAKNQPPTSFLLCSRSVEPTLGHTRHHIIKNYGQEAEEFKEKELLNDFKDYKNSTIEVGARMPFFMHRNLWNRMSGVDEAYFSYCTDDDLIQTAYSVGCRKFWMVYDSLVYHLVGKSNKQQSVDRDSDAPYRYFIDKWRKKGYPEAEHPGQWHPKMLPFYTKIR